MDFNDDQWQNWTRLMKLTQGGDKEAYERLLVEMSPVVFNFVRKRVFNQNHVEDVFQEVLLSFHKAKHSYRTDLPFPPWFFAVIRNAVWAALKKNHKIGQREVPLEDFFDIAALETAEDGIDDRIHQALGALPEMNRQAVEMLKLKGMSVETAAKTLGISKAALRVRAHRGYSLLKKILKTQVEKSE
ncbi:MAG TPA: sigma-70 family RNA polymerase sigma factor [bacterium]|nr:sigma-70 family RNA polymerase sigma factor [bacterium]